MITTAYESLNTPSTPVPRCSSYLLYVSTPSQHLLRQGPTVTLPFYCNLVIQRCVSVNRQLLRRLDARGGSEKQVFPHNPRRQKSATSNGEVTDVKVRCTHDLHRNLCTIYGRGNVTWSNVQALDGTAMPGAAYLPCHCNKFHCGGALVPRTTARRHPRADFAAGAEAEQKVSQSIAICAQFARGPLFLGILRTIFTQFAWGPLFLGILRTIRAHFTHFVTTSFL